MNRLTTSFLALTFIVIFSSMPVTADELNGIPTYEVIQGSNGEEEIEVHTKLADYLFSNQGGLLKSVFLHFTPFGTGFTELIPSTETRLNPETGELLRTAIRDPLYPFELIVGDATTAEILYETDIEAIGNELLEVRFSTTLENLRITKVFSLSENPNYAFDFRLEIENTTDVPVNLTDGVRISLGNGIQTPVKNENPDNPEIFYLFGGLKEAKPLVSPSFEGLGYQKNGLALILHPNERNPDYQSLEDGSSGQWIELDLAIAPIELSANEIVSFDFLVFAGRDKYLLLEHLGLGYINPPGFGDQFIIPIVQLLEWLYGLTGNYGWAIIIFTLITRILLFPLFRKQFHSMSKLAKLRPKMEKIQQRYPTMRRLKTLHPNMSQQELMKRDRENRRTVQEKMMEMYREEGVNPLGGCLPLLVQFPILIVLWQAILYSAEIIHFTPGFLWMSDLSMRDPTYILVALTAIAMILQTRTTPQMTTSGQGPNPMVFMLISVGLMVILLRDFPSGLWLYYFLTTIVQVVQQVIINWEMKHMPTAKSMTATTSAGETDSDSADDEVIDVDTSEESEPTDKPEK